MSEPDVLQDLCPVPWWRRKRVLIIFALAALMLLALCAPLAMLWYLHRAEEEELQAAVAEADRLDPGWRLEQLEAGRPVLPDERNSALRLSAAKQLLPPHWPGSEFDQQFEDLAPEVQLNEQQIKALREELNKVVPALEEARKLADLPGGYYRVTWNSKLLADVTFSTPYTQEPRSIAGLLRYDVLQRAQEGRADEALQSCRAILNAGRSLGGEAADIPLLVRIACQGVAVSCIERTLAQGESSEAALKELQRLLQDEEAQPLLLMAFRAERALYHAQTEAIRAGEINDPELKAFGHKDVHARMLRMMTEVVEIAKLPLVQQPGRLTQLQGSSDKAARSMPSTANIWAGLRIPSIIRISQSYRRSLAWIRCTVVAVAVERYRRAHGRWPASLTALVAHELDKVPDDPYDGKPLRFRPLHDGVVIYSVGPDGKDDGGKLNRKDPTAAGSDLGIQLWDVPRRRQPPKPAGKLPEEPAKPPVIEENR